MTTVLTISGQPGSGTTTVAENIEERLDATYVNAGEIFRLLAADHGMSLSVFSKHVNENPEIDRSIDHQLRMTVDDFLGNETAGGMPDGVDDSLELGIDIDVDAEYMILESRLAGWIAGADAHLRIWCQAPLDVRCDRLTENTDDSEKADELVERQADESMRYDEWYNIDIADTTIYDLVVNTARWNGETVTDMVIAALQNHDPADDEGPTPTESPFLRPDQ